jgi:hypothetical protein
METIWIGLIAVIGPRNNQILDGCHSAFVNVLAISKNSREFVRMIKDQVKENNLEIEEIIWIEMLEKRLEKYDMDDYLIELAGEIKEIGSGFRFGIFHAWGENAG